MYKYLAVIWILLYVPSSAFSTDSLFIVNVSDLYVRERPSSQSEILGTVKQGDSLYKVSQIRNWVLVKKDSRTLGYVGKRFLQKIEAPIYSKKPKSTQIILDWSSTYIFSISIEYYFLFFLGLIGILLTFHYGRI